MSLTTQYTHNQAMGFLDEEGNDAQGVLKLGDVMTFTYDDDETLVTVLLNGTVFKGPIREDELAIAMLLARKISGGE